MFTLRIFNGTPATICSFNKCFLYAVHTHTMWGTGETVVTPTYSSRVQNKDQWMDKQKGRSQLSASDLGSGWRFFQVEWSSEMTELPSASGRLNRSAPTQLRLHHFHVLLPKGVKSFLVFDLKLLVNKVLCEIPSDELSCHCLYSICPAYPESRTWHRETQVQILTLLLTGWVALQMI